MWLATIREGKFTFGPRLTDKFKEFLAANEGRVVSIELARPKRSQSQNAYYWVYLGVISEETGNTADDLHEYFKRKLLPPVFKTICGEEIKLPASTTDLGKLEFGEYLDKIAALTEIPLPDPEAAGYISNYDQPLK